MTAYQPKMFDAPNLDESVEGFSREYAAGIYVTREVADELVRAPHATGLEWVERSLLYRRDDESLGNGFRIITANEHGLLDVTLNWPWKEWPFQPGYPKSLRAVVFSGDWTCDLYAGFEPEGAHRWNGAIRPWVTRDVAERVVAEQARVVCEFPEASELAWDDDVIVLTSRDDGEVRRFAPRHGGFYDVSFDWMWTWEDWA